MKGLDDALAAFIIVCIILLCVVPVMYFVATGGFTLIKTGVGELKAPGVCDSVELKWTYSDAKVFLEVTNRNNFIAKPKILFPRRDLGGQTHWEYSRPRIKTGETIQIWIQDYKLLESVILEQVEGDDIIYPCHRTIPFPHFQAELDAIATATWAGACENLVFEYEFGQEEHVIWLRNKNSFPVKVDAVLEVVDKAGQNYSISAKDQIVHMGTRLVLWQIYRETKITSLTLNWITNAHTLEKKFCGIPVELNLKPNNPDEGHED